MIRSGPVNYDYISLKTRFEASFPENMDGVTPKVPLTQKKGLCLLDYLDKSMWKSYDK